MSRNGSGSYSLPAGNPVTTGTSISSTWANSTLSDIASALTQSVSKDGQTTMTGNLPMGNNKVTGLADGTLATDAVSLGQLADDAGASLVGYLPTGTGAVATTVEAKLQESVSAQDRGATGLGVVSDNTAIQNAVNDYAFVYLPPGTYLAHRISIPAGHVLFGAGESTIIKRDYYLGAVETALTILADNSQLLDLVIDGNKAAAPAAWGTGTYIQSSTGSKVDGVKYKNCKRDGLFALDADDFTLTNITTETNERVGIAVTGNCHGFDIAHIRSTGDTVGGVDLEPDTLSTENTNFNVSDVIVDGTTFSVQGLSTSIVNRGGVVSNILAKNAGTIRFNKFDDLAVSGIYCDSTSLLKIEDSYPTVFGRGTGQFSSVSLEGLSPSGVNQVPQPYFTSMTSLSWTPLVIGGGSVSHVNSAELGKYVAQIEIAGGVSGDYAFYVSPSITVGAEEHVALGGMLKATIGRPYIEIQYRVGTTVLDTYRAAGGTSADSKLRNFLKFTKTPATCDNVRFLIGGTYDVAGGNFSGQFDGFYVVRNAFATEAGAIDKTLTANKAYDPASLATGVGATTTVTCTGAALGDVATATFSLDLQGVQLLAWVSAANTVSCRFQNQTGGTIDLANGVLTVKVAK